MEIIGLILFILYMIWLNRLINFGVKSAQQIVYNTEKTAHYTQMMYLALPPELRERSEATLSAVQPRKVK